MHLLCIIWDDSCLSDKLGRREDHAFANEFSQLLKVLNILLEINKLSAY